MEEFRDELREDLNCRFHAVEELVTNVAHGLERQMSRMEDHINQQVGRLQEQQERHAGLLQGGSRAITRFLTWSEKSDARSADLLRQLWEQQKRIDDLVSRVSKLERNKRAS